LALPENTPGITRVESLFTYHIFGYPAELQKWQSDVASYSLEVGGLVGSARRFSLTQITGDFDAVEDEVILQCMTNIHWGRVRVRGARISDVLNAVGTDKGAVKVALRGAEGFTTDLFLEEIVGDADRFLLVYEMNGRPLSAQHGFPIRSSASGKYGFKWCKWLVAMEVVDYDYKGHYEGRRGWSDKAVRGRPVQ